MGLVRRGLRRRALARRVAEQAHLAGGGEATQKARSLEGNRCLERAAKQKGPTFTPTISVALTPTFTDTFTPTLIMNQTATI